MVGIGRWRRAFCTSGPKEEDGDDSVMAEKQGRRRVTSSTFGSFGFFSTPSTPPGTASNPSSPPSASSFTHLLKPLRLSKNRCGICLQRVKSGHGTAIFTGECSHSFHFSCIATHVSNQVSLLCPICGSNWNELPLFGHQATDNHNRNHNHKQYKQKDLKIYNDDEPLTPSTSSIRCNPIPESDENEESGFFNERTADDLNIEARFHQDSAIISTGRNHETIACVLKLKAIAKKLTSSRRSPIDLVVVLDIGGGLSSSSSKIELFKETMRILISFLSSSDRLSIIASSSSSKRLFPLRRMTSTGRRSARRIAESLASGEGSAINEALLKAAKVVDDRREMNPSAVVMLISTNLSRPISSPSYARFVHLDIPGRESDQVVRNRIRSLLTVVARDVRVRLGLSGPGEVVAVYTRTGKPAVYDANSVRLGDLYEAEERELLVELKICGPQYGLYIRCSHRDPSSLDLISGKEQALVLPRAHPIKSSSPSTVRLRNMFITRRAIAESRRVSASSDIRVAVRLLSSARALVAQSGSSEFVSSLEAEIEDLCRRQRTPAEVRRRRLPENGGVSPEERKEPLTPTSAWRAAERLAKVAIMRKSLNRVSDLHGFENARF